MQGGRIEGVTLPETMQVRNPALSIVNSLRSAERILPRRSLWRDARGHNYATGRELAIFGNAVYITSAVYLNSFIRSKNGALGQAIQ